MEDKRLSLPSQRNYEYGYELAYKLACEQLARLDNIEQQCRNSGAQYLVVDSQKVIILEYLNQSYQITLPAFEISLVNSKEEVSIADKVLLLHYLTLAKGTPLTNRLITFKELPEGSNYFRTFWQRAIKPLVDHFGSEPQLLVGIAQKLGGSKIDYGDVAVTVNAFRRVPVTLVLWRGDDEFTPEGSIIFDSTIADYLSTYDITVLCETIAWRLVKCLKGKGVRDR